MPEVKKDLKRSHEICQEEAHLKFEIPPLFSGLWKWQTNLHNGKGKGMRNLEKKKSCFFQGSSFDEPKPDCFSRFLSAEFERLPFFPSRKKERKLPQKGERNKNSH